jgi:hypothetical protein
MKRHGDAMLVHPIDTVKIEALLTHVPATTEVDFSSLTELGMSMPAAADGVIAMIIARRSAAIAPAKSTTTVTVEPTAPTK